MRGRGMFARFRYNDLKGVAVIAADEGPVQFEWSGGLALRRAGVVRRSRTADTMREEVSGGKTIL